MLLALLNLIVALCILSVDSLRLLKSNRLQQVMRERSSFEPLYGRNKTPTVLRLNLSDDMDRSSDYSMEADDEEQTYLAINELKRIYNEQDLLHVKLGRSASVKEWAMSSGYHDSGSMLAALDAGRRAQTKLVRSQKPMIGALARKYASITSLLTLDDLVQEGTVGLLTAVQKFDPSRGSRFSSFASLWVKASMLRAISNKDRLIRLPVYIHDMGARIREAETALRTMINRDPSEEEVAAAIGTSLQSLSSNRELLSQQHESLTESDPMISDTENTNIHSEDVLRILSKYLDPREMEVLSLRFGLDRQRYPLSFHEISLLMRMSAEGIRKVALRAMSKLRYEESWRLLSEFIDFAQ